MKNILVLIVLAVCTATTFAQLNQVDSKGRKQGEWAKTYPDSRVYQYRGQFKDDKPVGTFTYFYPSQKVKAIIKHQENSNRSVAYFYHENKEVMSYGIFRDMKKDSVWLNFAPSGRISNKETYKMDSLDGLKTVYFLPESLEDKRIIVAGEYLYKNGTLDGPFKEYFDVGTLKREGAYLNGRKQGVWITYEPTGKKLMLERYKNGVKHGWFEAYENSEAPANKVYYYYGQELHGDRLKKIMDQFKASGKNPNE